MKKQTKTIQQLEEEHKRACEAVRRAVKGKKPAKDVLDMLKDICSDSQVSQ